MKTHTVNIEDFKGFYLEHTIASSSSKYENKTLTVQSYIETKEVVYIVVSKGDETYKGPSLELAIEAYNRG